VVLSRVVKLNSLLPASAAAPKIKLNCAKRRSFFSFLCVLSRPNGIITLAQIFYDREHQSVIINPFFSSIHQTGIRSHKDNQKDFMNKSLQDIRAEVVSSDIRTKSIAIEKATYLHSLGFNMNWASFHVVELMSTANVKYKRVGYLAACQSFGEYRCRVVNSQFVEEGSGESESGGGGVGDFVLGEYCHARIVANVSRRCVFVIEQPQTGFTTPSVLVSLQVLLAIPGSFETVLRETDRMFRR
jgi:hypothetical protein